MPVRLPLLFGIATAFGLSSTVQSYLLSVSTGRKPDGMIGHLLLLNLVYWYVPALVSPLVFRLAARYQFARGQGWRPYAVHLAGALAYSLVHSSAMLATRVLLMHQPPPSAGWWFGARIEYLTQLDWVLMTYLFLVGIAHALEYRRESERRAVDSAHLETRLIEAQLESLQRQLQPHFLFNTLNAISGLMRTDVEAADRMMDRLGHLLRMALDSSTAQEVPLKDELEVLHKYLDIEQVRFGARLQVTMRIETDALAARVPNFLLQPLVENAVRHGVAPFTRPGHVEIEARRERDRLVIRIMDSGDGVAPSLLTLMNQGVGLSNTRARLQHLYGRDHAFVFSNEAGFCVKVAIPFVACDGEVDEAKAGAA
ncbi:MAG: sensor histidine kinase [Acidobacteria bacterium]|nr:sensor histidine kinase [Acidobacteriota bacterium]